MNINDIYSICQYIVNKYTQGYFSPNEFNLTFNLAQRQYFNELIGSVNAYTPGRPVATMGKMYNQTMQEKLSPFFTILADTLAGNAQVPKPADFASVIDLILPSGVNCKLTAQNKQVNTFSDSIDPVTIISPIAIDKGLYFQVLPDNGWAVGSQYVMNYYKKPPDAKWAYTGGDTTPPVYDEANSIQPLWQDGEMNDLIARTCSLSGINLNQAQIVQYTQLQKQEG